jgi:GTP-binding protein YchF
VATNLTAGLVGFTGSGKTTVFNLLTGQTVQVSDRARTNVGMARVPDPRVDLLSTLFKPRRTVYAQIQFSDVPGLVPDNRAAAAQFLSGIRDVDLLIYILNSFADDCPDPLRDLTALSVELLLVDMEVVERRLERIRGGKKPTPQLEEERELLTRCLSWLEQERRLDSLELDPAEKVLLRNFGFLTDKPVMAVVNLDEAGRSYPNRRELTAYAAAEGIPVVELCGRMEMEINQLAPEDRAAFMADLGIEESGIDRVAREAYRRLGLVSFFTVGEDEVKAWTVQAGTHAVRAAGRIHSDIERGFIRAEVYHYNDLAESGTVAAVREKGRFRLEGKDYPVKDGDIINFRFNVGKK